MREEVKVLTREDLKALKACGTLVFKISDVDNKESIRCIFDNPDNLKDYAHIIEINPRKYIDYSKFYTCIAVAHMFSDTTRTIIESLKAGDILYFGWHKDKHTNAYMEKQGLCGDTLELIIERKNKRLKYEINTQIKPLDQRMINIRD